MALHIADTEVSDLMALYSNVTGMSKTEALRRLLKDALSKQDLSHKPKPTFRKVAEEIMRKNAGLTPVTKEEVDSIFE